MEMLVVLTIGSVMLGIGVGMLHLLLQSERMGRNRVHWATVSARLAEQFRADAAAAVRHNPFKNNSTTPFQFALPEDHAATYRMTPGEVRRDESIAGKPARQETYILPDGCSAVIIVEDNVKPPTASLIVTCNDLPTTAGREMRISAVLGKDHRFTTSPVEGK